MGPRAFIRRVQRMLPGVRVVLADQNEMWRWWGEDGRELQSEIWWHASPSVTDAELAGLCHEMGHVAARRTPRGVAHSDLRKATNTADSHHSRDPAVLWSIWKAEVRAWEAARPFARRLGVDPAAFESVRREALLSWRRPIIERIREAKASP